MSGAGGIKSITRMRTMITTITISPAWKIRPKVMVSFCAVGHFLPPHCHACAWRPPRNW